MDNKITAIVLTKNEEKNIKDCLESIKWTDELIVVDDYSRDKTLEIVKKYNSKIYQRKIEDDFSKQRNFAIEKATTRWILFVDADERIPEELKNEIIGIINFNNNFDAYKIKRIDNMWGKKIRHGEQGSTKIIRLFKKEHGKSIGKVHEIIKIKGKVGKLNNYIIHYPHPTVNEFLREINKYSTIRAMELYDKKIKANFLSIIFYTTGKFIKNYFFMLGILDGIRGLILAILMSFHSFLSRGKLWLLWKQK